MGSLRHISSNPYARNRTSKPRQSTLPGLVVEPTPEVWYNSGHQDKGEEIIWN